jgi:arginine decarboxylase-like protein
MQHILLGTDSRGAYFEDFLSQHNLFPNDWEIHIDVTPGGTIKTISEKHLTKVKTLPVTVNTQIVIMIAGGICNLTVISNSTLVDIFECIQKKIALTE